MIRNFHNSTQSTDISDSLPKEGHSMKYFYGINNNNHPLTLFFIKFISQDSNIDIHNNTSLLNIKISI
ncbi:Nucleic-acid-binding protein [Aphis craccivora]|uniref:Nucleic-acid-binding protein n=1 Tax=Aphis craccivora TaxID=307492 RepID=A0A6G0ZHL9_APHCR|nr:Nucleic-acid-binding protein [Aphis craccivora]